MKLDLKDLIKGKYYLCYINKDCTKYYFKYVDHDEKYIYGNVSFIKDTDNYYKYFGIDFTLNIDWYKKFCKFSYEINIEEFIDFLPNDFIDKIIYNRKKKIVLLLEKENLL